MIRQESKLAGGILDIWIGPARALGNWYVPRGSTDRDHA